MANPFDTRPSSLLDCDECSGDGYMDFCDRREEDMARLYESIKGPESEEKLTTLSRVPK